MSTTKVDDQQVENAVLKFLKDKLGIGKKDDAASASFSEVDAKALIDQAVKVAIEPLNTKITSLETENKELKTQVAGIGTSSSRAEIVSFCETLEQAGTLPRSFRHMGGVEFMEAIAALPADKKVATIEFAEEGGKRVEKKTEIGALDFMKNFLKALPRYVQFGEAFGDATPKGDGSDLMNPEELNQMRGAIGLKTSEAAK